MSPWGKNTVPIAIRTPKMMSRPSRRNAASHAGSASTPAIPRSASGSAVSTSPPTTGPTNVRDPPTRTKAIRLTLVSNVPCREFHVLMKCALTAPTAPASIALVVKHGQRTIATADLVIFLVDGREGLVSGDETIARELRETGKPILVAVNKIDDKRARNGALDFYRLGLEPVIEVSAFVSPKWVPQMADAADVFAGLTRRPGVRYTALVPNLTGLARARDAGADEVAVFPAASEAFSRRNLNQSIDESLSAAREVCREAAALRLA